MNSFLRTETISNDTDSSYIIKHEVLYTFINGGVRNGDFLSPVLSNLDKNNKSYLIFSDENDYNKSWDILKKEHHIRASTIHLKYLLELRGPNEGKKLLINYMWTQILEYLLDNMEFANQYKSFMISENDVKICDQELLDEFILTFNNDSSLNVMHLWDSCTKGRKQAVVKTWGKFHLIRKNHVVVLLFWLNLLYLKMY